MKVLAVTDLGRNSLEIQEAALRQPVVLTDREKPRYVMLSIEGYIRLCGASLVVSPEAIPDSVAERIQAIADSYP
jgi:PHD/YefM family antitoxin component YafN of YafNO toxin-antitoxin module